MGSGVDGEPRQALGEVDKWCRRERKKECWRKEEKWGSYGSGSLVRKEGALGRRHREHGRRVCLSGRGGGEDPIISKFIATATTNLLRGHRAYPPPAYWTTASSDRCPSTSANGQSWEPTAEPAIISLMSQERTGVEGTNPGPFPETVCSANKMLCLIGCSTGRSRKPLATEPQRQCIYFTYPPWDLSFCPPPSPSSGSVLGCILLGLRILPHGNIYRKAQGEQFNSSRRVGARSHQRGRCG